MRSSGARTTRTAECRRIADGGSEIQSTWPAHSLFVERSFAHTTHERSDFGGHGRPPSGPQGGSPPAPSRFSSVQPSPSGRASSTANDQVVARRASLLRPKVIPKLGVLAKAMPWRHSGSCAMAQALSGSVGSPCGDDFVVRGVSFVVINVVTG